MLLLLIRRCLYCCDRCWLRHGRHWHCLNRLRSFSLLIRYRLVGRCLINRLVGLRYRFVYLTSRFGFLFLGQVIVLADLILLSVRRCLDCCFRRILRCWCFWHACDVRFPLHFLSLNIRQFLGCVNRFTRCVCFRFDRADCVVLLFAS